MKSPEANMDKLLEIRTLEAKNESQIMITIMSGARQLYMQMYYFSDDSSPQNEALLSCLGGTC